MLTVLGQSPLKLATMAMAIHTTCKSMEILPLYRAAIAVQAQLGIKRVLQLVTQHLPMVHLLKAIHGIAQQTKLGTQHLLQAQILTVTVSHLHVMNTAATKS